MSPTHSAPDRGTSKKQTLRLQLPADDPEIQAFLDAQGQRHTGTAVVQLIRLWINEFGPVNVMERCLGGLTVAQLRGQQPGDGTEELAVDGEDHTEAAAAEKAADTETETTATIAVGPAGEPEQWPRPTVTVPEPAVLAGTGAAPQAPAPVSTPAPAPLEPAVEPVTGDPEPVAPAPPRAESIDDLFRRG